MNAHDAVVAALSEHEFQRDWPNLSNWFCPCLEWSMLYDGSFDAMRGSFNTHLAAVLAPLIEAERAAALREFADTRGVNVGDEDDDWWSGYRQAQRECLRDAINRADSISTTHDNERNES